MILIDGGVLLHRILALPYFAEDVGPEGEPVGGVSGAVKSIYRMVRARGYLESVAIAWDGGVPEFRRELSSEYKRSPPDAAKLGDGTLYRQCRDVLHGDVLPMLGCLSVRVDGAEADDVVSVMVRQCGAADGAPTTIYSTDQDFLQLLRQDRVEVAQETSLTEVVTEAEFVRERKLHPIQWRVQWKIFRAIRGDASDGLRGIKGLGDKGAANYAAKIVEGLNAGQGINEVLDEIAAKGAKTPLVGPEGRETLYRNLAVMDLDYGFAKELPIYDEIGKAIRRVARIEARPEAAFKKCEVEDGVKVMADGIATANVSGRRFIKAR